MNIRPLIATAALLGAFAASALTGAGTLFINGKPAAHAPISQNGETWVSVSDLKAAGAQVTVGDGRLSIRFRPDSGGAHQITGVEGAKGEWLFNGIWRLRATAVEVAEKPFSNGVPGWAVTVEIRNGSNKEVSLFNTGVGLPTLALADGTILKADEGDWQTISFRQMLPGAAVTHALKFWFPSGTVKSGTKPAVRLVVPVDVRSGLLRDTGLHYTGGAPAFRVTL